MIKRVLILLGLLAAFPLAAQQATLTTPEALTATKALVRSVDFDRTTATITVELQTSGNEVKRTLAYATNSSVEYASFLTAIGTARASETGSVPRRMQFRVLGWMADNNHFTAPNGDTITVTVVP